MVITGEGPSRDMYKGHMDKAKGGMFEGGRRGWGAGGDVAGRKWSQVYLNISK